MSVVERRFFKAVQPCGFILFQRNCVEADQIRELVADLRDCVGDPKAPILIDQEGGRVQRLKPPHWRQAPSAASFGRLARIDVVAAIRAAWINARLIAADLTDLGITVNCTPVLDHPVAGAHNVIGDRAYADNNEMISRLGRAVCEGLRAGGVLPVIKHIPGHGRATVDSHNECPVVSAGAADLLAHDVPPFRALADQPFAMTAHVIYTAWDAHNVATMSRSVIDQIIRRAIGFDGVLMSDDLGMKALGGSFAERTIAALGAGCDVVLHCSGNLGEMAEIAAATPRLSEDAARRWQAALAMSSSPEPADRAALFTKLAALLKQDES